MDPTDHESSFDFSPALQSPSKIQTRELVSNEKTLRDVRSVGLPPLYPHGVQPQHLLLIDVLLR